MMPEVRWWSPVGELLIRTDPDDEALVSISFGATPDGRPAGSGDPAGDGAADGAGAGEVIAQLAEYFRGERQVFTLPLRPRGSAFQIRVWEEVARIPYGETVSYGELAKRVPGTSARAIGRANATNPIPIIVPCHRVIGADGSLVGYGGGLSRKRALLTLEGIRLEPPQLDLELGGTGAT